jgi:uncharacterized membrane protein
MHGAKLAASMLWLMLGFAGLVDPSPATADNLNQRFGPSWACTNLGAVEYSLYRACKICEDNCQDFFEDDNKAGHCVAKSTPAKTCSSAASPQATTVATGSPPPASPSAAQDPGYFEFKVCNRSGRTASVAVEHYVSPADKNFVVQGWWTVPTGGCQSIGNFPRGWFYYYAAESGTDAFEWAGNDAHACIERIGTVERMHPKGLTCANKYLRGFHSALVDFSSVTWNLDP